MENYLIISHGSRHINLNYDDSHFKVPDGFNIITITQPNETLWDKTIKIFITEITNLCRTQYYQDKINSIIEEKNLQNRAKECINLENEIIINYIKDKIVQDTSLLNPLSIDDENLNQFERFLFNIGIGQITMDRIINIETLESELLRQLDAVKNELVFQIRVYTSQSSAPIMSIDIDDANTLLYQGIYNLDSIRYDKLLKGENVNTSIFNFKDTNKLDDKYTNIDNVFTQLKNNGIPGGNLFIISCAKYDIENKKNLKSRIKLIRKTSRDNQGRGERKYFIYYN